MTRLVALVCVALAAFAFSLDAQAVRGRLVEAEGDAPIVGALVVLEDSGGNRAAQAVSGAEGRYFLRAPSPGPYRLRVLRIGFAPVESPVVLAPADYLDLTLKLSGTAIALPEIAVAGTSVCGDRSKGDTLSSALWLQAGTALGITAQTVASRSLRFVTVLESRNIDRFGTAFPIEAENAPGSSAWPVRSPSADTLLASGFVENMDDVVTGPTWYGPDAEFLLSEPFFRGHCFHTVPATDSTPAGWVGLAFEPATEDHRVDIRGTLWMDRESAQLRRLDFTYTRVPRWARGFDGGGSLVFAPLAGGGWIVQRWLLRVPLPQRSARGTMQMFGYRESGGRVRSVRDRRGNVMQTYEN